MVGCWCGFEVEGFEVEGFEVDGFEVKELFEASGGSMGLRFRGDWELTPCGWLWIGILCLLE